MRLPRFRLALAAGMIATIALAGSASAIVQGEPDAYEHPHVGQLFFFDPTYPDPRFDEPGGWFNCTGTLINSQVVLTAGHCTYGTGLDGEPTIDAGGIGGNDVWVTFREDVRPFYDLLPPSLSFGREGQDERYDAWTALLNDPDNGWVRGTSYSHPEYNDAAFFLHDVGVVILDEPVEIGDEFDDGHPITTYGELPTEDYLDRYDDSKLRRTARFQPVGYGIEVSRGYGQIGGDHRMKATSKLVNVDGALGIKDDIAVAFSNNNGQGKTGGTCNGDSGGPVFDLQDQGENLIVAVTSFGVSNACRGIDGAYRIDQADDLEWLVPIQGANDYDGEAHED